MTVCILCLPHSAPSASLRPLRLPPPRPHHNLLSGPAVKTKKLKRDHTLWHFKAYKHFDIFAWEAWERIPNEREASYPGLRFFP